MELVTDAKLYTALTAAGVTITDAVRDLVRLLSGTIDDYFANLTGTLIGSRSVTEYLPATDTSYTGPDVGWYDGPPDVISDRVYYREFGGVEARQLVLKNLPVRSVSAVYANVGAWTAGAANGDWPANTLIESTGYSLDLAGPSVCESGILYRNFGAWPRYPRSVRVDYTAGRTGAEFKLKYPFIEIAAVQAAMNTIGRLVAAGMFASGVVGSGSVEDFSESNNPFIVSSAAGGQAGSPFAVLIPAEYVARLGAEKSLAHYFQP